MPPKRGKMTAEQKKFQQYQQQYGPIFKLFDGDNDQKLTYAELLCYLEAIALPKLEEKVREQLAESKDFSLDQTVQIQIMIEKTLEQEKKYYEKLVNELYSALHCEDDGFHEPIVERKFLKTFLQAGENPISNIYLGYMDQAMDDRKANKVNTCIYEKHLKEDGLSADQVQEILTQKYTDPKHEKEILDLRQLVLHMQYFQENGVVMIKEIMDAKKKAKQAAKDKAAKNRK